MAELVFRAPLPLVLVDVFGGTINVTVRTLAELQTIRERLRDGQLKNLPDTSLELQLWLAMAGALGFLVEE